MHSSVHIHIHISHQAQKNGVTLVLETSADLEDWHTGDVMRLQQIYVNYIDNGMWSARYSAVIEGF